MQLRVKGVDSEDLIITASSVPSICPSPKVEKVTLFKNTYLHLTNLGLADD